MTTAAFPLPSATAQGTIEWPYTYGVPDGQYMSDSLRSQICRPTMLNSRISTTH